MKIYLFSSEVITTKVSLSLNHTYLKVSYNGFVCEDNEQNDSFLLMHHYMILIN